MSVLNPRVYENNMTWQVDESDYDDRTALHIAASMGHKSVVRILIERFNASITVKDRYCGTPMDDAIREGHAEVVHYLAALLRCDHHKLPAKQYTSRLIQAAADDDVQRVEILLSAGVDPNCADYDNRTPLHLAAANSSMKVLKCLLEHPQTQLGPIDDMAHTPLWDALCAGHRRAASMLQSAGAPVQPDIAEDLCKAAAQNDANFFQMLSEHNIDMWSMVRKCLSRSLSMCVPAGCTRQCGLPFTEHKQSRRQL